MPFSVLAKPPNPVLPSDIPPYAIAGELHVGDFVGRFRTQPRALKRWRWRFAFRTATPASPRGRRSSRA
eukprot:2421328-Lingulodinium_polyedra.AAC.1